MDKIKITIDSKVSNVVTISYNLEKITIDVVPKKKKEKESVQIITLDEEKDQDQHTIKTDETDIIDVVDDEMDVENSQ
ncbi:hypothetical protein RCNV-85A-149 [Raccoonpox virus]|uniref:Uncharacterized protein n=1 Tax=Raccoon poxvirus TaxID=10256 RepID=A0A0G3G082_RACVI|nr:hypothetical protein ACG19_gp161 [Raccoonpox virus]AKJ93794.1 hypothetical protein RCNV-Herman-161 [Raccoonpox virus]AOP31426.1 hypothetical protein RCNV-85A-149 [Raccoonpox virus]